MAFDLLEVDGTVAVGLAALGATCAPRGLFPQEPRAWPAPLADDLRPLHRVCWLERSGGALDGVIAKRADQEYRSGERAMIKVKQQRTADCVVGGFRYAEKKKEVGSLLLGLYDARASSIMSALRPRFLPTNGRNSPRSSRS